MMKIKANNGEIKFLAIYIIKRERRERKDRERESFIYVKLAGER